jgi:hypothetical protein
MIYGFLDDSGKEGQETNPYVVMAGYIGSVDLWLELSRKWIDLLVKHGINAIHMKDLIPLTGEYKTRGWGIAKRDEVMSEFLDVLRQSNATGIGIAVDTEAWRAIKKEHPQYSSFFGTAQEFCMQRIIRRIVDRLHEIAQEDQVTIVWDRDHEFAVSRVKFYGNLIRHDPRANALISAIMFADPNRYPALQCADILAWETRKELTQKAGGHKSTRRWRELFSQMPDIQLDYMGEFYDRAELDKYVPAIIGQLKASRGL